MKLRSGENDREYLQETAMLMRDLPSTLWTKPVTEAAAGLVESAARHAPYQTPGGDIIHCTSCGTGEACDIWQNAVVLAKAWRREHNL